MVLKSTVKRLAKRWFRSEIREMAREEMRMIATSGVGGDWCLEKKFLPVPVHFYSPIPDLDDLERRKIWEQKCGLAGIEFCARDQLRLLMELGKEYGAECNWPYDPTADSAQFFTDNSTFGGGCAAVLHAMIRRFRPATVMEIGSGKSSIVIADALRRNVSEGHEGRHVIVNPYPGELERTGRIARELVVERVELLDPGRFDMLAANDILFIDSSHTVRIGSDVNFLFLEVLPRLAPGVLIHVHDIRIPYEYSRRLAVIETFRQFWTEQYLLQAFLCFNSEFEILLACNYLMVHHGDEFRIAFPHCVLGDHPSSFWFRRKLPGGTSKG